VESKGLCAILMAVMIGVVTGPAMGADWYVDPINGSDSNGGTSWEDAWKTLSYACYRTKNTGTEDDPCILHAGAGVYSPSTNGEDFPIQFEQGTWSSADYRLGSIIGAGPGETILNPENSNWGFRTIGEGITISDLTIVNSHGHGIYATILSPGPSKITLERCVIKDNAWGGALKVCDPGTVLLIDCVITGNVCHGSVSRGGAVEMGIWQDLNMTNCLVANNTVHHAGQNGGGIVLESYTHTTITNCTFVGNTHGIYAHASCYYLRLYNCILWGNDDDIKLHAGGIIPEIYHCNISDGDGLGENGNICEDPLFVSGPQGDYYLSHAGVNSKKKEQKKAK